MRVTAAIREYVESKVQEKYEQATENLRKEYDDKKAAVTKGVKAILLSAEKDAIKYITDNGFVIGRGYCRGDDRLFTICGNFSIPEEEEELNEKSGQMRAQRANTIKEILFNLEVGKSDKSELESLLNDVKFE